MRSPGLAILLITASMVSALPADAQRMDGALPPGVSRGSDAVRPAPWLPVVPPHPDSAPQDSGELNVRLLSNLQSRLERNRNERCVPGQTGLALSACRSAFQPLFDFDFHLLVGGSIGGRVHVDVDYDSQREFDASNQISVAYRGRGAEFLRELTVGNVAFQPPFSRFISAVVPNGNYGVQAHARAAGVDLRALLAQQKGRVVRSQLFTLGGRTVRSVSTQLPDFGFEPRRFFFTIDPALLDGYPNIDILDGGAMARHAASLPDTLRPRRLAIYRVLIGAAPPNPNGPRFIVRGARNQNRGLVYERLREGVDYYVDPSLLWIALQRQLRRDERLVAAWHVLLADSSTVYPSTGGTPDLEYTPEPQYANLIWDAELQPSDAAFNREIRSAYRVAGSDLVRESLELSIVSGPGSGEEKGADGSGRGWLEIFGVARRFGNALLDTDNRIWPRDFDPNYSRAAGGSATPIVGDNFLIFPSLQPFARDGLAGEQNPANDAIYTLPAEDLYSARRPASVYRMRLDFATEGDIGAGGLMLGNIQLRPGSERVVMDGVLLERDVDYVVDYEMGRVTFARPDTIFAVERRIQVQYEETPLFAETPASISALSATLPLQRGSLSFLAVNQSQRSPFTRPTLGFEPSSSLLAAITGAYTWDLPWLGGGGGDGGAARGTAEQVPALRVEAEVAASRPDPNSRNIAWLETFQGSGGVTIPGSESVWRHGSIPAATGLIPDALLAPERAATMAWQNYTLDRGGNVATFRTGEIDPNASLTGRFSTPEPLLWLTLFPLGVGGVRAEDGSWLWSTGTSVPGRRWRSISAPISPTGSDLTRVEHLEFWALVDTSAAGRAANPTIVIDLGDISENSLTFAPETAFVNIESGRVTAYRGRRRQGADTLNSERDPFTRAFDAFRNDNGLPGDVADRVTLMSGPGGTLIGDSLNFPVCISDRRIHNVGDPLTNCTVGNARLDEEDLDGDGVLNFGRDGERLLRFVVNTSDAASFHRTGNCVDAADPRLPPWQSGGCWVNFRVPLTRAERHGDPLLRRIKGARITLISGAGAADAAFTTVPLTRITLATAPWERRSDTPLAGITGTEERSGWVSASLIGTQDSTASDPYQPPPGVREESEDRSGFLAPGQILINERSLRLRALGLNALERAEAFSRFPDGERNFMGYSQLRLWARGGSRLSGWGDGGELEFFLRIGDAANFYLYRTPLNSGPLQSAWEPEIRIDLTRFHTLRALVQEGVHRGVPPAAACTAADSALVYAGAQPQGSGLFACDGGYIIYTASPVLTPPSLSAVQEVAVGMIRLRDGGGPHPIVAGDTLELWVDEIRLAGAVNRAGLAAHLSAELSAPGVASVGLAYTSRDRNFRTLGEPPHFAGTDILELTSTVQLGRIRGVPQGWSLPLTIAHSMSLTDPYFLAGSDIRASGVPGVRTPRSARTSYSLGIRREESDGSPVQELLRAITVNATYRTGGTRSEYTDGRRDAFAVRGELNLGSASVPCCSFAPSALRVFSGVTRENERRTAFLLPGSTAAGEIGSGSRAVERRWESGASVELRPAPDLVAQLDATTVRDMAEYGDSTAAARAAAAARTSVLGIGTGLERTRSVRSQIAWSPAPTEWLRLRFTAGSRTGVNRDPAGRLLVTAPDDLDHPEFLLPRSLASTRQLGTGFTLDWGRLAVRLARDSAGAAQVARILAPLDVNLSNSALSLFAAADFAPSLWYHLPLIPAQGMRSERGARATSAGETNTLAISQTVRPVRGVTIANRGAFSLSRHWSEAAGGDAFTQRSTVNTFPDVTVRFEGTPGGVLRSLAAQSGARQTVRYGRAPGFTAALPTEFTRDQVRVFPTTVSANWSVLGGIGTSGEYSVTLREEERTGIRTEGENWTAAAELTKTVPRGSVRGWEEDIRIRLSYRETATRTMVYGGGVITGGGVSGRLVDNGRHSVSFTMDSGVGGNATLALGASQIVTFDRNFSRRITQTLLTALLQIEFQSVVGR